MSTLNTLKLTAQQKPTQPNAVQQRRNKLARRLGEQIEVAKALQNGLQYKPTKLRTVKDADGTRRQVEMAKRVKTWWFTADNGKLALSIRYGSSVLELAKNRYSIEVGTDKELVAILETVRTATLSGELDAAIVSAATKLREGFGKR